LGLLSISFGYFFLVVATLAWLARARPRARNALLLVASYAFYATWHVRVAGWLLALSVIDWALGEALARMRAPRGRRAVAVLGVLANVGLLATLKTYDFFRESVAHLAAAIGLTAHLPVLELVAPVGLSFFTFQGIAYLVDAYRGQAVRASLLDFLLFMAYFPKLLAGPICRSQDLLPQLAQPAAPEGPDVERAVALVLAGLAKKMVLATYLATHLVGDVFEMPERHTWLQLAVGLFAYSAEIYLDFSGYTDLARGISLLLGFELPENFRQPYAATSLGDFWKRWHLTFSSWLRDYVYFPLGGSRRGRARTYANLLVTMLVCGLWHGASAGFLAWGLAHGLGLVGEKIWRDLRGRAPASARARRGSPLVRLACGAATVGYCALARVFFRSEDIGTALTYLRGLAKPGLDPHGVDPLVVGITAACYLLNVIGPKLFDQFVEACRRVPRPAQPLAWAVLGIALLACRTGEVSPYIYFGF
jgi:D-alanyl-lipoteichoic acid acyltransferase DltB (MBOAT superfamily)